MLSASSTDKLNCSLPVRNAICIGKLAISPNSCLTHTANLAIFALDHWARATFTLQARQAAAAAVSAGHFGFNGGNPRNDY